MTSSEADESLESYGAEIGSRTTSFARLREWVLVGGDRLALAFAISIAVFVFLLALGRIGVVAFVNDDSVTRLASGMVAGTFSLVTLVVSINQLILSREFSSAGETRDQLEGVAEFQRDVEDAANVPASPATPTKLLELIAETIHYRARALADAAADHDDEAVRERISRYADGVEESTERIRETLEEREHGTFTAVLVAIEYDEAWQLYAARQLRNRHADELSDGALETFDGLIDSLRQFTVAREHFKTTYIQRELTRFSQLTIYCGVPAVLAALLVGFLYADVGGPTVGIEYLPYVVSGLVSVVTLPLALLTAYILRTATITRRTASIGPMLPQKDPGEGPFEVSHREEE